MLRIIIVIMASFFSSLFSQGQDKNSGIFPGESFAVVEGDVNGKPAIGSVNQAYKKYDKKAKYAWCLKLSIGLDLEHVDGNGLPVGEESKIATKLEDELFDKIKTLAIAHYIGHLFNDTFLDVYIYLDDPKK